MIFAIAVFAIRHIAYGIAAQQIKLVRVKAKAVYAVVFAVYIDVGTGIAPIIHFVTACYKPLRSNDKLAVGYTAAAQPELVDIRCRVHQAQPAAELPVRLYITVYKSVKICFPVLGARKPAYVPYGLELQPSAFGVSL